MPPRKSDNEKRRLHTSPTQDALVELMGSVAYGGISKHKRSPKAFQLPIYSGKRGDETLCDEHAGFQPADMAGILPMIRRGIRAGLIGNRTTQGVPSIIWAVSDAGWIFEARISNPGSTEYHGYPVRPSEVIAEKVYERFAKWAEQHGSDSDRQAAENCRALYGFR